MLKKCFALLAACLLVLSVLAGCGKKGGSNKTSDLETDDSVAPTFERVESKDAAGKVQTVGDSVIYDCYTFESVDSETVKITGFYSQVKGNTAAADDDTQSYVLCLEPHTVCVPKTLAGKTVVKIEALAFYTQSGVADLVLPDTLTAIGRCAFAECFNLRSVTLPASVTALGEGAFYKCTGLVNLGFAASSALSTIPKLTFEGCSSLTAIHIPGYIKTVGEGAFLNCSAATVLTLEEGLVTIEAQAFQYLGLTEIPDLPSTVTSVGELNPWEQR